jgi:hypothetical protein
MFKYYINLIKKTTKTFFFSIFKIRIFSDKKCYHFSKTKSTGIKFKLPAGIFSFSQINRFNFINSRFFSSNASSVISDNSNLRNTFFSRIFFDKKGWILHVITYFFSILILFFLKDYMAVVKVSTNEALSFFYQFLLLTLSLV